MNTIHLCTPRSFTSPANFSGGLLVIVSLFSAGINLAGLFLLRHSRHHHESVRGLYLHLAGDLAGSLATFVTGVAVAHFGAKGSSVYLLDPVLSLLVSTLVIVSSAKLALRCIKSLMLASPIDTALFAQVLRYQPYFVSFSSCFFFSTCSLPDHPLTLFLRVDAGRFRE